MLPYLTKAATCKYSSGSAAPARACPLRAADAPGLLSATRGPVTHPYHTRTNSRVLGRPSASSAQKRKPPFGGLGVLRAAFF